ncbi:hypothetical protein [Myxococcus sp. CA018]|nr:hypothetical protein [Myxococcus sp. CA018]NOK01108.1 hypothetical protein [Myxococcus xanthus]
MDFQQASVTTTLRAGTGVPAERRPSVGYGYLARLGSASIGVAAWR